MLHLISHRPKEALQRLESLAEGSGVEIEAGGAPAGSHLCNAQTCHTEVHLHEGVNHRRHNNHIPLRLILTGSCATMLRHCRILQISVRNMLAKPQ